MTELMTDFKAFTYSKHIHDDFSLYEVKDVLREIEEIVQEYEIVASPYPQHRPALRARLERKIKRLEELCVINPSDYT